MGKCTERLYNGIVKENPTFVQMLGMCPTLAVTSSAINGAGMGLATTCILVLSNMMISMLRKVIPDKVRIPSYIVIIASFVTIIQFLMQAYLPSLNDALGIYIPLIVVNCIILGRAESYASKNKVIPSMFDGIGMGLGFTLGLTLIGAFRELIGKGEIFGVKLLGSDNIFTDMGNGAGTVGDVLAHYTPVTIFVLAPGAFFVLAFIIAFINRRNAIKRAKNQDNGYTCKPEGCAGCTNMMCGGKLKSEVERIAAEKAAAEKAAAEKAAAEKAAAEKAAAEKEAADKTAAENVETAADENKTAEAPAGDTQEADEKMNEYAREASQEEAATEESNVVENASESTTTASAVPEDTADKGTADESMAGAGTVPEGADVGEEEHGRIVIPDNVMKRR